MKKQWRFWLGFVVIILVVLFSVLNTEEVEVNFGFIQMKQPLVIVIVGSVFIGALIMFLLFFSSYWKRGRKIKTLEKELQTYGVFVEPMEKETSDSTNDHLEIPEEDILSDDSSEEQNESTTINSRSELNK